MGTIFRFEFFFCLSIFFIFVKYLVFSGAPSLRLPAFCACNFGRTLPKSGCTTTITNSNSKSKSKNKNFASEEVLLNAPVPRMYLSRFGEVLLRFSFSMLFFFLSLLSLLFFWHSIYLVPYFKRER